VGTLTLKEEVAPPFAVFEGWDLSSSTLCVFRTKLISIRFEKKHIGLVKILISWGLREEGMWWDMAKY
jgi:hypothetical protein